MAVSSFLGIAKRLLRCNEEELEVGKSVSPVKPMAMKIHIEFSRGRQPDLTFGFRKAHGAIFDVLVLQT